MSQFEAVIEESRDIAAYLPQVEQLKEAVRKAGEWTARVSAIQVRARHRASRGEGVLVFLTYMYSTCILHVQGIVHFWGSLCREFLPWSTCYPAAFRQGA